MKISNSNWTEWSTIQGVIGRVISKSAEREARGRFEITSSITPWIVRHEVQLLINRNYNKIREEYDSGLNYLTGLYVQLLSYMPEKKSHSSATSASSMTCTVQLLRHDAYNCPITSAWRVQLSNYVWNQACWGPIRFGNFDIVVIVSNSNWTEWSTIQGVIGPVISNRPSAKRKADLKLRARLLPELYDTKSNY